MNPVEALAIQTCYTRARFIAAHLKTYFDECDDKWDSPDINREVLHAADSLVKVLRVHLPQPTPQPREFIEGYDDVPDEDHGAGRIGR